MCSGSLRQHQQAQNDEPAITAEAIGRLSATRRRHRLVEEIADRSAERPRQDEGRPEQQHTREARPEIERGDDGQRRANTSAPPCIRARALSADQSPSAVPSVCEKVIVTQ